MDSSLIKKQNFVLLVGNCIIDKEEYEAPRVPSRVASKMFSTVDKAPLSKAPMIQGKAAMSMAPRFWGRTKMMMAPVLRNKRTMDKALLSKEPFKA